MLQVGQPGTIFFNGKKVLLFLQEKMIKYIAYRLNQYLKKTRITRLPMNFRPLAKGDVIRPKQIRDVLSPRKRKQIDCLLIKPHLQLKRWKNKSNNKLKSFLSLSDLKVINCKVVVISRQKVVLSFEKASARLPHF